MSIRPTLLLLFLFSFASFSCFEKTPNPGPDRAKNIESEKFSVPQNTPNDAAPKTKKAFQKSKKRLPTREEDRENLTTGVHDFSRAKGKESPRKRDTTYRPNIAVEPLLINFQLFPSTSTPEVTPSREKN